MRVGGRARSVARMGKDQRSEAREQVEELGRRGADAERRGDVTQVAFDQRGSWLIAGIHLSPIAPPAEGR